MMDFVVEMDRDAGLTFVEARPGHYDAHPPVERVTLGHAPQVLDADLEALLCVLVFHEFIADEVRFNRPCSPLFAEALRHLFHHRVQAANVDRVPRAARGGKRCAVVDDGSLAAKVLWCLRPPDSIRIRALSDSQTGDQAGSHEVSVITSLGLLGAVEEVTSHRWAIALAALVATDFGIRTLCLPATFFSAWFCEDSLCPRTGSVTSRAESIRRALDSFGLRVAFPLAHLTDAGVLDLMASDLMLEEWEKSEFSPRILTTPSDRSLYLRMLHALGMGQANGLLVELGKKRTGEFLSRIVEHERLILADAVLAAGESLPDWKALSQLPSLAENAPPGWSRDRLGDSRDFVVTSNDAFSVDISRRIPSSRKRSLNYAKELRKGLRFR